MISFTYLNIDRRYHILATLIMVVIAPTVSAQPESTPSEEPLPSYSGPFFERTKLTGDWLGKRSGLEENRGITLDVSNTQYYQGITNGGVKNGFVYGGRNDYYVNIDGESAGLWKGFTVDLHGETRYGQSVNSRGGTLFPPNLLLAVPQPNGSVTVLTNVRFTQALTDNLEVYAGKLNTLDDFFQPLTGANSFTGFQNTALLYNPVYARTIPYSTYGAGFAFSKGDETLFEVTVYDTNDTPTTSGLNTFFNNGVTIFAMANLPTRFFGLPGHQGVSGTYSTGKYSDLHPSAFLDPIEGLVVQATRRTGSWCLAYNFDQAIHVSPDDPKRMWGLFGNLGIADQNLSPTRWFASGGISGASPIGSRKLDTFGIGYFYMGLSNSLKELAPRLLSVGNEHGVELYYNFAVTPWCQITPDIQVITPFRSHVDPFFLTGLRMKIDF